MKYLVNGGRAHYIIESKVQWKPFWLAIQQYPENDWLGGNFPCTMTSAHRPHCNPQCTRLKRDKKTPITIWTVRDWKMLRTHPDDKNIWPGPSRRVSCGVQSYCQQHHYIIIPLCYRNTNLVFHSTWKALSFLLSGKSFKYE